MLSRGGSLLAFRTWVFTEMSLWKIRSRAVEQSRTQRGAECWGITSRRSLSGGAGGAAVPRCCLGSPKTGPGCLSGWRLPWVSLDLFVPLEGLGVRGWWEGRGAPCLGEQPSHGCWGGGGIAPLGFLLGAEASQGPSRGAVCPVRHRSHAGEGNRPPLSPPSSQLLFLVPFHHFPSFSKTAQTLERCVSFSPWHRFARPRGERWVSSPLLGSQFRGGGCPLPPPPRVGCRAVRESGEGRGRLRNPLFGEIIVIWNPARFFPPGQPPAGVRPGNPPNSLRGFPRSFLQGGQEDPWPPRPPPRLRQRCGTGDGAVALPGGAGPCPQGWGRPAATGTGLWWRSRCRMRLQLQMPVQMVLPVWFPTENPSHRPEQKWLLAPVPVQRRHPWIAPGSQVSVWLEPGGRARGVLSPAKRRRPPTPPPRRRSCATRPREVEFKAKTRDGHGGHPLLRDVCSGGGIAFVAMNRRRLSPGLGSRRSLPAAPGVPCLQSLPVPVLGAGGFEVWLPNCGCSGRPRPRRHPHFFVFCLGSFPALSGRWDVRLAGLGGSGGGVGVPAWAYGNGNLGCRKHFKAD